METLEAIPDDDSDEQRPASSTALALPFDLPAAALVQLVQSRQISSDALVRTSLQRIALLDERINAFQLVRDDAALQEARVLERRADLGMLPLAGLPVAIKDNLEVAGTPTRFGSLATAETPAVHDHEVARRVAAAGAIVVGKTRLPELGIWATTDGAWGITRNPWDETRTPGGSSGGSAAAVAAGMVPFAIGNDGLGSIRIPAACCGLIGFKPGAEVVPSGVSASDWFGFTENGVLATTVDDAALLLSVMSGRADLRDVAEPQQPLCIALSTGSPSPGLTIDREYVRAARAAADLLAGAGHTIERADPPYSTRFAGAILGHWFSAVAREVTTLDPTRLEPRTRAHARWGALAERLRLVGPAWRVAWRQRLQPLFDRFDVLLTPTLAMLPPAARAWAQRSWLSNLVSNLRFAPLCAPWNLAGYPAASVPFGRHSSGLPIGIQIVSTPGREDVLLALARTLERLHPWPRHAPTRRQPFPPPAATH